MRVIIADPEESLGEMGPIRRNTGQHPDDSFTVYYILDDGRLGGHSLQGPRRSIGSPAP